MRGELEKMTMEQQNPATMHVMVGRDNLHKREREKLIN